MSVVGSVFVVVVLCGTRWIISFVIHYPDLFRCTREVPDLKSRTRLAHSNLPNEPIYGFSREW